jgi:monooxygenase
MEHFDVLIVGAGLSGIGAARHLQRKCPNRSFAILEGRAAIGGTWDLFRYPGIRSDSDMYTLGYAFRPWTEAKAIADGPSILNYVRETAREAGIDRHIRFRHKVVRASWSTRDAAWTVEAERTEGERKVPVRFTCNSCAAATTATRAATRPTGKEPSGSKAASFIPRPGRRISITPASVWW